MILAPLGPILPIRNRHFMLIQIYHILGRIFRLFPKVTKIKKHAMEALFFVPINNHYICDDLSEIKNGKREPKLYQWLNALPENSVYFDVGTSYGQEVALASSFEKQNVKVVGFDCSLYLSHFCCLNKSLNRDRFDFVFAAVSDKSGQLINIKANSDTHIPPLHKKNVPYAYNVLTISLDDYSRDKDIVPSHIKIDVDGAEDRVIEGAKSLLSNKEVKEIFIEIDNKNLKLKQILVDYGFTIVWEDERAMNTEALFIRS